MKNFNINLKINDVMAESSSVVQLYVNDEKLCSLCDENKYYSNNIEIDNNEATVQVKSTYHKGSTTLKTKNPIKKVFSYIVLFIVNIFSIAEKLEYPYEFKDKIEINVTGNEPYISFSLYKPTATEQPQIFIDSKDISFKETKDCYINKTALKEIYNERKKATTVFSVVASLIFLIVGLVGVFLKNYTTFIFSLIIIMLFVVMYFCSINSLNKQYKNLLKVK